MSVTQPQSKVYGFAFEDGEWWLKFKRKGQPSARHRARVTECETCGRQFVDYPHGKTTFCSEKCRRVDCKRCGKRFHPESANHRFCSDECKRGTYICENCGKEFAPSKNAEGRFCSRKCFGDGMAPVGSVRPHGSAGYTIIKVADGTLGSKVHYGPNNRRWMFEHRYVMQQKLGRALVDGEEVHHLNGNRADNRPENLELWNRSHPSGVRAKEKFRHINTARLESDFAELAAELARRKKRDGA